MSPRRPGGSRVRYSDLSWHSKFNFPCTVAHPAQAEPPSQPRKNIHFSYKNNFLQIERRSIFAKNTGVKFREERAGRALRLVHYNITDQHTVREDRTHAGRSDAAVFFEVSVRGFRSIELRAKSREQRAQKSKES